MHRKVEQSLFYVNITVPSGEKSDIHLITAHKNTL